MIFFSCFSDQEEQCSNLESTLLFRFSRNEHIYSFSLQDDAMSCSHVEDQHSRVQHHTKASQVGITYTDAWEDHATFASYQSLLEIEALKHTLPDLCRLLLRVWWPSFGKILVCSGGTMSRVRFPTDAPGRKCIWFSHVQRSCFCTEIFKLNSWQLNKHSTK